MTSLPGWTALKNRWAAAGPRWKAILALVLVFAAGLAGGALVEDVADDFDRPLFAADRDDDDDDGGVSEETLLANLDLTAEQRARIEQLFEAREDRLEAFWDGQLPQLQVVIDSSREEIRGVLTPAQRTVYDSQVPRLYPSRRHELGDETDD
jgi:hypothetical protein